MPRADRRAVDVAIEMDGVVRRFNGLRVASLSLRVNLNVRLADSSILIVQRVNPGEYISRS